MPEQRQPVSSRRHRPLMAFAAVALLLTAAGVGALAWDSKRPAVVAAVYGYLGDLRGMRNASAAMRIDADDLIDLKRSVLARASEDREFRADLLHHFGTTDPAELASATRGQFFEFLMKRTYESHPEVFAVLTQGRALGLAVSRSGDSARVDVTLGLDSAAGTRHFHMNLQLRNEDGVWMVRL